MIGVKALLEEDSDDSSLDEDSSLDTEDSELDQEDSSLEDEEDSLDDEEAELDDAPWLDERADEELEDEGVNSHPVSAIEARRIEISVAVFLIIFSPFYRFVEPVPYKNLS